MTGFERIEKAMHDARLQCSDARYNVCVSEIDCRKDIGYTSLACCIHDNTSGDSIFIHVCKWTSESSYIMKVDIYDARDTYHFNSGSDVANAVYLLIKTATL